MLREPECNASLIAISQAAASDHCTPPKCAAALATLLYMVLSSLFLSLLYIYVYVCAVGKLMRYDVECNLSTCWTGLFLFQCTNFLQFSLLSVLLSDYRLATEMYLCLVD